MRQFYYQTFDSSKYLNTMTEFSKNSRNNKADTISNTGGRSGQGPTNPYSNNQSESPSRYSQHTEEQSHPSQFNQQTDDNFELPMQYIMPLISTIKDENDHLKGEREYMQSDLSTLQFLSQNLLSQNQSLRKHYSQRTNDIRRIIETISINANEEISDINHQSHLFKECNFALVKKIEEHMKYLNSKEEQNSNNHKQLIELSNQSMQLEQAYRDLQISNKQLFNKCQQLKVQNKKIDLSRHDQTLNQLLFDVISLRNSNKYNLLKAKSIVEKHRQQKPAFEQNHAHIYKKNRQLQSQVKELKQTMNISERKMEESKYNYEQSLIKQTDTLRQYQNVKFQNYEKEQQIINMKKQILECNNSSKKNRDIVNNLKDQKYQLSQKIKAYKQKLKNNQKQQKIMIEQQKIQQKSQEKKIKNEISQQSARANQQIMGKLNPESVSTQEAIIQSKEEYAILVQQIDQLRQSVHKLQNPIKQIIRMDYQLKKNKAKKY